MRFALAAAVLALAVAGARAACDVEPTCTDSTTKCVMSNSCGAVCVSANTAGTTDLTTCPARCASTGSCRTAGEECRFGRDPTTGAYEWSCVSATPTTTVNSTEPVDNNCVSCLVDECAAIDTTAWNCQFARCVQFRCAETDPCRPRFVDIYGQEVCARDGTPISTCTTIECGAAPTVLSQACVDANGSPTGEDEYWARECRRGPDGRCGYAHKPCPAVSECPRCTNTCPNGFQYDTATKCPKPDATNADQCLCRQTTCSATSVANCPAVVCAAGSEVRIDPTTCCPTCIAVPPPVDRCANIQCPRSADGSPLRCNATTQYLWPREPLLDRCCDECRDRCDPTNVRCPAVTCAAGFQKVNRFCCEMCEPIVDCSRVTCPAASTCDPRTSKLVLRPGQCCPDCVRLPTCDNAACPTVSLPCPAGSTFHRASDQCCGFCRRDDVCAGVSCPRNLNCPYTVRRPGSCCDSCIFCKDERDPTTNDPVRVCDLNDELRCAAGYRSGTDCTTPVTTRDSVTFRIRVDAGSRNACPTVEEVRDRICRTRNLDPRTVSITLQSDMASDGTLRCIYTITVALPAGTRDPYGNDSTQAGAVVQAAIDADPAMSNYNPTTTATGTSTGTVDSSSSTVVASFAVVAAAIMCV